MSSRGFSLLEVMVALAIMAGTVVTVLAVVNNHLSIVSESSEKAVAALLARQKLAELATSQEKKGSGSFTPDFPDYRWSSDVVPMQGNLVSRLVVDVRNARDNKGVSLAAFVRQ